MRVLLVNKYFYARAGAEANYFDTRELLLEHGHSVLDFAMRDPQNLPSAQSQLFAPARNYTTGGPAGNKTRLARDALASVYSVPARRSIARLLDGDRPDVAHLHNIYHQLTYSIVDELAARGIPMVQTIHDWKLACPSYTLFRDGGPCRVCVGSLPTGVVRHSCIKDSRSASLVAAVEAVVARHRRSALKIHRYIAPSAFAASVAVSAGIPRERLDVILHALPDRSVTVASTAIETDPVFVHAGRLEETKGVRQLLSAFDAVTSNARLEIMGWGDLAREVEAASGRNDRISFLGRQPREKVLERLRSSRALLLPSIWEDNCPLIMLEAQAQGTPVIVSNLGGPPEFVRDGEDGFVIDPHNTTAFAARIDQLATSPELARKMGEQARTRILREHSAAAHHEQLVATYRRAIAASLEDR